MTIRKPLLVPCWHPQLVLQLLLAAILYTSYFFDYIQAPSMIINKINNTKTIAADDPQFAIIFTPPFFVFSHYFMGKR